MVKSKNESNNENSGTLLTDKDGTQYFVMGKVRIKVSEHFAQDGKPLDRLLEDVIRILSWGKYESRYRSISHRTGSRLTACWKM